jgi:hypothetical protein
MDGIKKERDHELDLGPEQDDVRQAFLHDARSSSEDDIERMGSAERVPLRRGLVFFYLRILLEVAMAVAILVLLFNGSPLQRYTIRRTPVPECTPCATSQQASFLRLRQNH